MLMRWLALSFLLAAPAAGQTLEVRGEVSTPLKLALSDLEVMPRQTVEAADHQGGKARYSGVPLFHILQRAGVPFGDQMRGKVLSQYVLITAADGYRVVFALPELDPRATDDPVLLCDRKDDNALDQFEGPLRIILPKEKRHARWIRQVIRIEILSAPAVAD